MRIILVNDLIFYYLLFVIVIVNCEITHEGTNRKISTKTKQATE